VPTINEFIAEYVQQQLDQPHVREKLENAMEPLLGFFGMVGMLLMRTQYLPPSSGYEPLLVEENFNQIAARGIAHIAIRHGRRMAKESYSIKPAADAIRFLAKSGRHSDSVLARAKIILSISEETSVIETIFESAGLNEFEFLGLLKDVVDGNKNGLKRISEIAALASRTLSIRRGPKITAASAAHEFFMEQTKEKIELRAYTYDDVVGDFTDPLTMATRREFDDPHFDPKPARRRLKARKGTKTLD
jgi:hypothetical protein